MSIVDFTKEAKKRNVTISSPEIEVANLPPEQEVYEGDFIYNEDRVNVKIDTLNDKTTLVLYDTKTNEKYTEFEVDCFTMFLLAHAFMCLYDAIEDVYSIH